VTSNEKQFIEVWNRSESLIDVSKALGIKPRCCSARACKIRRAARILKLMPAQTKPLAERFWGKVRKGAGCWVWTGSRIPKGYGKIQLGRRGTSPRFAHRISWELHFGPIPQGLWVLHKCDNPSCVKPSHLFLGTAKDNTSDMMAKGRNRNSPRVAETHS
jgi:hypothetical protein